MTLGMAEFAPATVINIPKYLTHGFFAHPIIGRPMSAIVVRPTIATHTILVAEPSRNVHDDG
jgi:hypothetical protein